ncbi:nucleotide-binding universal stress UspA family protein [Aeromicrobium panaciterrae]|uniref:Nucleotide-binding universal stress UspA family protein n=1 Tax=Aeromicrobium panaciterrae TaxID=363861 RepID=A0ABU1UMI0_9ACTN|nr:universal stress protein [Aeromicrobium panaciterrae]MDR7086368.1 nucleotide-binding universal stress UspA family protein [Aeromicrobium panaciterrae]
MSGFRPHVVVGVSRKQPGVIRQALAEADRLGAALHVVHCHDVQLSTADFHGKGEFVGSVAASAALTDAHDFIKSEAPSQIVNFMEVEGETSKVLLAHARDAQTIILGAGEASWLDWVRGGTMAGRIARDASCPVIMVPERCASVDEHGAIVVTIDGDTSAFGPLSYGFEQAQSRDRLLIILHAVPLGTSDADFESHRANVAEIIAGWNGLFPDVKVLVSSTIGDAVDACVGASSSASLVVIGRPHGRVGSFALARPVAMSVLRRAQCAVAIVPRDYRHDRVSDSTRADRQSTLV